MCVCVCVCICVCVCLRDATFGIRFRAGRVIKTDSRMLGQIYICISAANMSFPGGSVVKNSPANAGDSRDAGSIPGLGISLGGGKGNPLQYSCLENLMDRGVWQAIVHGVAKSWTQLNVHTHTCTCTHRGKYISDKHFYSLTKECHLH